MTESVEALPEDAVPVLQLAGGRSVMYAREPLGPTPDNMMAVWIVQPRNPERPAVRTLLGTALSYGMSSWEPV